MEKIRLCAGLVIAGAGFVLIFLLANKTIAPDSVAADIVKVSVGILLGWGSQVVSFYWGSSQGSADKTKMIESLSGAPDENKAP